MNLKIHPNFCKQNYGLIYLRTDYWVDNWSEPSTSCILFLINVWLRIRAMNSLDIELYEYAQQLFEKRKLKFKLWGEFRSVHQKSPFLAVSTKLTQMKTVDISTLMFEKSQFRIDYVICEIGNLWFCQNSFNMRLIIWFQFRFWSRVWIRWLTAFIG